MSTAAFLGGRILLALPGMGDPNFERSVIALVHHDEQGAFGINLGQVLGDFTLHGVLEELQIEPGQAPDAPIHRGGPVETGRGFVLHSPDWQGPDTISAGPLGAVSASRMVLEAIAAGTGPERWLVALGYAGWGPGQLEGELRRHGWHVAKGRPQLLFDVPARERWRACWLAEGVDPALLSGTTGTA